jgi:hypothetical protein
MRVLAAGRTAATTGADDADPLWRRPLPPLGPVLSIQWPLLLLLVLLWWWRNDDVVDPDQNRSSSGRLLGGAVAPRSSSKKPRLVDRC